MHLVAAKILIALTAAVSAAVPGAAIMKSAPDPQNGYDVSYPQCSKSLPKKPAFSIVGVNDGLANTTNDCLVKELAWGKTAVGAANQQPLQLYVNTANPAGLGTPSWPQDNTDPLGNLSTNPYGDCDGSNSSACAWQYGWNRAVEDNVQRFAPAATLAGIDSNAGKYTWWLDVETINSWLSGSADDLAKNAADLEGMTSYFQSTGATVGLYSTTEQWNKVVGTLNADSPLNGLVNWRPGAKTEAAAKSNCSLPPLTLSGKVIITQYLTSNQDYDNSCL